MFRVSIQKKIFNSSWEEILYLIKNVMGVLINGRQ